ncbi:MAG: exodeoxyribonuclease VII large subunit [Bacillota bacterium]
MADTPVPMTVGALNAYVSALIASDTKLRDLCVLGEISNFKRHSSGHLYFSLKDATAVVRCVMFRSYASGVRFDLADGVNVCARGYVSIYERDGQYQLYAQALEPQGLGALYEKFEALKARLKAEGLFDPSVKKPLPSYPRAIGVVTSPTGAAVRDIIHVLTRRNDSVRIVICPAKVQGAGAAGQIAAGIKLFNRLQNVDVIIVGRGGGSMEELWAFNEEAVARSIYKSRIPVISAVGHETDFTITDFVADLRAPTPSAAAEMAVGRKAVQIDAIAQYQQLMHRLMQRKLDKGLSEVEHFKARLDRMRLQNRITVLQERVGERVKRLNVCIQSILAHQTEKAGANTMRLHALSPMRVLSRGYTFTRDDETGRIIPSAAALRQGQRLKIVYRDGQAGATVTDMLMDDGKAGG